jgi:hypothetical protein
MEFIRKVSNIFWAFHKAVVQNNLKYQNIHKGETCLIFGNGGSLKYYDLSAIGKKYLSIGCTYSLVDKRLSGLEMNYCVIPSAYFFYYFRLHSYAKKIIINLIGKIVKKIIIKNTNTRFFVSLTNYYSLFCRSHSLSYFHHFGDKTSNSYDLAGNFSTTTGALEMMISLAKFMGFAKVILLGCDYLGSPTLEGHFYADSIPFYGADKPEYVTRIKKVAGELDVVVILKKGSLCPVFESYNFEEYFGAPEYYQSNTEFIDEEYLIMMRKAEEKYTQIWM